MGTGTTARRAPWALLWGGLVVLGWAVLSSLLGGGTAHAADAPADAVPSPLSKVTDLVTATATAVSDLTDGAVQPVGDAVETAVDAVKPPVEKTVAVIPEPVRMPVSEVVAIVRDAPVTQVLRPVADSVAELPVVGAMLDSVAVPELIDRAVDTVDDVLGVADSVVSVVLPPAVDAIAPGSDDAFSPTMVTKASVSAAETDAVATRVISELTAAGLNISLAPDRAVPTAPFTAQEESPASDPTGVPDPPASPTTSAGQSGSSAGVPASAHGSRGVHIDPWTRTIAHSDSVLPSSPAGSTDISPD